MEKLNIFTVEELIFLNPKAKQVLWKEFPVFFKEYSFLKQASIDHALFNKFYINFLREFSQKNVQNLLDEIFGKNKVLMNYNFKNIVINTSINLTNNKRKSINNNNLLSTINNKQLTNNNNLLSTINNKQLTNNKRKSINNNYNKQLITNKQFKVDLNIENFSEKFEHILKIYPHFFCTRNAQKLDITFWR